MHWSDLFLIPFLVVWMIVTLAPMALAMGAWNLATAIRRGWIVHILFLPVLFAAELAGARVMFLAAGDTGDTPGLGIAMFPAAAIALITVSAYYLALFFQFVNVIATRIAGRKRCSQ